MSSSILFPTNQFANSSKSHEQIQRLMMPLFQTCEQTITYIINKGLPVQMPYVYRNFWKCYRCALSTVCSKAPTEDNENQIVIAQSLRKIISDDANKLTDAELQTIFEMCIECLNNLSSPANEQMIVVVESILKNHKENRKLIKRLQEVILDLGKPTQPIISKVTSGRLISILAKYIGRMIKGQMIDILKRILADSQIQAKKVWVKEIFPKLLNNLELEFIELHLQEKIYETVYDENQEIGILALEVILKNVTKFSVEEQSSRIVKLFIDSLTSKNQKIAIMVTGIMGEAYQKLQNVILKHQNNCIKFWRSVIQISQTKNQKILNNLIYNLPGILILSNAIYKVEPICDVYVELFYEQSSNKMLLASYFHEIGQLFPKKAHQLRDVVYWMFNEIFQDDDPVDQALKVMNKIISNLYQSKIVFLQDGPISKENLSDQCKEKEDVQRFERYFDGPFCDYLMKYLSLLLIRKNGPALQIFYLAIKSCYEYFSPEFIEQTLLPKIYSAIRMKTAYIELVVEIIVSLLTRDSSSNNNLINNYVSKINIELLKSNKSYEREAAILFFYNASFYFSIDLFQQFKLGEKFIHFNNDKSFKNKVLFIKCLPRMIYFFNREEKIQNSIILSRLMKDNDEQILRLMQSLNFVQNQQIKAKICQQSKKLKEKEKERAVLNGRKPQISINRRSSKQIKKEDILKKRIETTKGKVKMVIKEVPKKKVNPILIKTSSNINFRKNA